MRASRFGTTHRSANRLELATSGELIFWQNEQRVVLFRDLAEIHHVAVADAVVADVGDDAVDAAVAAAVASVVAPAVVFVIAVLVLPIVVVVDLADKVR